MPRKNHLRLWAHLTTDHGAVRRTFPPAELARVETAIAAGEQTHRGQVCFAIEGALPAGRVMKGLRPRDRALEVFGLLRVWDTEENCGVLVYLLLADRDVEIVADRGIHRQVGDDAWAAICARMEEAFRSGAFAAGVEQGIGEISALLAQHFPRTDAGTNELSDKPVIL